MVNRRSILKAAAGSFIATGNYAYAAQGSKLEVCLLFDCSTSMFNANVEQSHAYLQKYGHIHALRSPDIARILIERRVLIRIIGWNAEAHNLGGPYLITSHDDISRVAEVIERTVPISAGKLSGDGATYHDTGIAYALSLPQSTPRRVIDISTDEGLVSDRVNDCLYLKKLAMESGTQINALAVGISGNPLMELGRTVCTDDGFLHVIGGWESYLPGIQKKFFDEIVA